MADESYEIAICDAHAASHYWMGPWLSGSGYVFVSPYLIYCDSGATPGSYAGVTHDHRHFGARWVADYDKSFELLLVVSLQLTTTNGRCYLRMCPQTSYGDMAVKGIGFKIVESALYGEAHDGTTRSEINLNTNLAVENRAHRLFWKFTPGAKIEWFVDGVSKGQLTSDLPVGFMYFGADIAFWAGNNGDSNPQRIALSRIVLRRAW